jgi:hypothetical protein
MVINIERLLLFLDLSKMFCMYSFPWTYFKIKIHFLSYAYSQVSIKLASLLNYFRIFEDHCFVFKELFSENPVLSYLVPCLRFISKKSTELKNNIIKKGYSSKIVLKATLQKSYIHRKSYKYKKYKIIYHL